MLERVRAWTISSFPTEALKGGRADVCAGGPTRAYSGHEPKPPARQHRPVHTFLRRSRLCRLDPRRSRSPARSVGCSGLRGQLRGLPCAAAHGLSVPADEGTAAGVRLRRTDDGPDASYRSQSRRGEPTCRRRVLHGGRLRNSRKRTRLRRISDLRGRSPRLRLERSGPS